MNNAVKLRRGKLPSVLNVKYPELPQSESDLPNVENL